ncbi:MAG: hypothetical protein HYU56_00615 [Candidatus Aenigmarchaeota archaeon]|nr:hypothetical protein [Candidatus Aenigmarchaeota archaeon]
MTQTIACDERGRILLAKDVREKYGNEFVIVKAPGELVLLPIPKNPLKALREEGKKIPQGVSVSEMKKKARDLALKEILEEAKELENPVKKSRRKK